MKPSIIDFTYAGYVDFKGYEKAVKDYRTDCAFPFATAAFIAVIIFAAWALSSYDQHLCKMRLGASYHTSSTPLPEGK